MSTWSFMFIPWIALVVGAIATTVWPLGPKVRSGLQHLAAGVVFAAAATEVLPAIRHTGSDGAILLGGGLGLAAMLGIKAMGERLSGAWALIALVGIDIFIDGVVLGIGFAVGDSQGSVLLVALTTEVLFLGLSATEELRDLIKSRSAVLAIVVVGGALLPLGALVGNPVALLPPFFLAASFAFALIALLYLVTEELLTEAHSPAGHVARHQHVLHRLSWASGIGNTVGIAALAAPSQVTRSMRRSGTHNFATKRLRAGTSGPLRC